MVRTKHYARISLARFDALFLEVVEAAWHDFQVEFADVRSHLRAGGQAAVIQNLMVRNARRVFDGVPGVTIIDDGQLFMVCVLDEWLVKFRKFREGLVVSTNRTQLALNFAGQVPLEGEYQLPLFVLDPLTHLHIGYTLNKTKTDAHSIHVVCPDGPGRNHWEFELERQAAGGIAPMPLPLAPSGIPGELRPMRRANPKQSPAAKKTRLEPTAEQEAREQKQDQAGEPDVKDGQS